MEVLDYLFEQEKKHREAVSLERRMKSTVFPVKKTLETLISNSRNLLIKKSSKTLQP